MVEVGAKPETARVAVASGRVTMAAATAKAIRAGKIGKGDVLGIARLAGIQAAKRASDLIPLCHPLRLTGVEVDLRVAGTAVEITATVKAFDLAAAARTSATAVERACAAAGAATMGETDSAAMASAEAVKIFFIRIGFLR